MTILNQEQISAIDKMTSFIEPFSRPERKFQDCPEEGGWPVYHDDVKEFLEACKAMKWPESELRMRMGDALSIIRDKNRTASASLEELSWMFMWWYEAEKLMEGHWRIDLENGTLLRMLTRLKELRNEHQ